jgi:hypothetical protein
MPGAPRAPLAKEADATRLFGKTSRLWSRLLRAETVMFFSFFRKSDPIDAFWKTFEGLAPKIEAAYARGDQEAMLEAARAVSSSFEDIDPDLCFEFGRAKDGQMEFCVTPDGFAALFQLAEQVVGPAPAFEGWRIFAYRRRKDLNGEEIRFGETLFSVDHLKCVADFGISGVALTLWFDTREALSEDAMFRAGGLFLYAAIGEYDAAMSIRSLDVQVGVTAGATPFLEFPSAFDAWKAGRSAAL